MKLAADANGVLAALGGGAARRILENPEVEVYTTRSVILEIEEYIPRIAKLKRVDEALLRMTLAHMPLVVADPNEYEKKRDEASRRIGGRDPDDVELLALALALGIPIWSNDNDFGEARVEWYTTAEILNKMKEK